MKGSILAGQIDSEYRRKQYYAKKKKRICNLKCEECKLYRNCYLRIEEEKDAKI